MVIKIALFNHKGGVSKTTTTFNLGWMLASKGKKVIIVDTDPQCNLTGLVLGYKSENEFETFYESGKDNLKVALSPAFDSKPYPIKAVDCISVNNQPNLFLLPGHIGISEYEVTLGMAQQFSGSIPTLKNLPGSMSFLFNETAKKYNADYMLIDMSPNLNSINQNLLMTSDYFIVPTTPDYFSVMALNSLAAILPRWHEWAIQAQQYKLFKDADYPFPTTIPKFLGVIIQRYRVLSGRPTKGFNEWIDEINDTIENKLIPVLKERNMILPDSMYEKQVQKKLYKIQKPERKYVISIIPEFNTLITNSQKVRTPIFALTSEQIGTTGPPLEKMLKKIDEFKKTFSNLSDKVEWMTTHAKCT
ncbi:Putative ATPases involved in chromosome partitioning [Methanocella conradii HZ254]|uniref:ATPases involved in chromosome partitioning n=1 Tax=Methanocella conradii (strain DSM 24694 / JCM 17849 / CGMCC 1.5162 / HZ254) TaxID=1041930 RepID=H8I678_METCZ|nr:AAA family ATPase [Methanocella conradii]AFD00725.1 Putative ATPases involved in chromosome partitioning [Methanocella conradii HZ254]